MAQFQYVFHGIGRDEIHTEADSMKNVRRSAMINGWQSTNTTYHQPYGFGWLQSVVEDNQSILQTMWQCDRK